MNQIIITLLIAAYTGLDWFKKCLYKKILYQRTYLEIALQNCLLVHFIWGSSIFCLWCYKKSRLQNRDLFRPHAIYFYVSEVKENKLRILVQEYRDMAMKR